MTVEVMSRDLRYSGKPGPSFRKSKEDLALFESINDLPDSNDLDSCLADVGPDAALPGDHLLEKDHASSSDTDKNDDDWLVPAPELSVSPQSHPSSLIVARNLSAIKTTRSATLEPARASTSQRNPSPRVYKGPESKISPSRIPRFNANTVTVRKSSPCPTLIPRAASSPSAIPRASTSGIRPPSPKSKWTTSTTPVKSTPQTLLKASSTLAARGSSPKFTRASTISPKGKQKLSSSNYGSGRKSPASTSITNLPSQPGSARSVKSVASTKASIAFLSETPSNLRTDPFAKRAPGSSSSLSLHVRSLSRSYEGPSYSGSNSESPSNKFQEYVSKSQDRGPFQYSGSNLGESTSDDRPAFSSDEDFPSKIPAYGGGVGRRTLKKDDGPGRETVLYQHDQSTAEDYSFIMGRSSIPDPSCLTAQCPVSSGSGFKPFMTNSAIASFSQHRKLLDPEFEAPQPVRSTADSGEDIIESSWDMAPKDRFGYGKVEGGSSADQSVKRIQMGFALKKEDHMGMAHTELLLPTSSLIDTKASHMEMAIPHLSTTAMVSHVEDTGPVKVYQGLGDMEDMEDVGGNWCCGMADRYRGLCKQHECAIYKNFHNALVELHNPNPQPPCSSTSSPASESDEDSAAAAVGSHSSEEIIHKAPTYQSLDSTPISEFLQPDDHASNCHVEAVDGGSPQRNSSARSTNSGAEVAEESERRVKESAAWKVKARSPEDTPPRRSSGRKKWELDMVETSARPRQLGKPPDFFDVTKRNEDGGVVAAISSVKSLSASECSDESGQNFRRSEPLNRSASMNGSHVSRSDVEDEESARASSDSEGEMASEFSRASSTKSNVRRFFSTSAVSIDLTRSIDTTCSTQSPYEYNLWEDPTDRYEHPIRPAPRAQIKPREPAKVPEVYDYGLEKLAGYIRSASADARKRRASSSESDHSKLSRESSFDYFVGFFEAQTNLDPEVANLLVSAHVEAKRVEFATSSLLSSASSLRSDKSVDAKDETSWAEPSKSIQTLENAGDGAEQIVENATHAASLDKHFSSFKFGQKKYPAGEFESITTLEVVPESPPSDSGLTSPSRRRHSKRFNDILISNLPSPLSCHKFLNEIEEQHSTGEGVALESALASAPALESLESRCAEEEEGVQAAPASPASPLIPKCESPRISAGNGDVDSSNEMQVVARVETEEVEVEKESERVEVEPDEEPGLEVEIEKGVVEQVLRPPVPNQMSNLGLRDAPVMSPMRMTSVPSPTKRATSGHEVGDTSEKTCGCTIL